MPRKNIIITGAVAAVVLLVAVSWFIHYSDRPKPPPHTEVIEEKIDPDVRMRHPDIPIDAPVPVDPEEPADDDQKKPREKYVDEILEPAFVNTLAEMIFESFIPAAVSEDSATFTLSFKRLNMHFATDLSDFKVDDHDILEARQEVLQHFLQPAVVNIASRFYSPKLLDRIVYLSQNRTKSISTLQGTEERLLTSAETADLFRLLSKRASYLAHVLEHSVRGDDVLNRVDEYLSVVDELNAVYFKYWQLDDDADVQQKEALGREIKSLIEKREVIRQDIYSRVASTDMLKAGHDYVYEAQWVYRRIRVDEFSEDAILSLSRAGRNLAILSLDRAERILEED